jgi:hypothetical protein
MCKVGKLIWQVLLSQKQEDRHTKNVCKHHDGDDQENTHIGETVPTSAMGP